MIGTGSAAELLNQADSHTEGGLWSAGAKLKRTKQQAAILATKERCRASCSKSGAAAARL